MRSARLTLFVPPLLVAAVALTLAAAVQPAVAQSRSDEAREGPYDRLAIVNAMVIPGQITRITGTFDEPGEYNIVCHEYCGIGHHGMWGKVVVGG